MSRSTVTLRDACEEDLATLAEIWSGVLRRAEPEQQHADLRRVLAGCAEDPDARVLVAEYDGRVAGAVHLRVGTLTPVNLEPVVMVVSPHVLPQYRRHGVGRALMDAATTFAEERQIGHVGTAAIAGARDANRFMARLGLAPQATLRVAPTAVVRSRLAPYRPASVGQRGSSRVLAVRRSQRRATAAQAVRGMEA